MRSVWAGAISFGLVNIPVRLYPAAQQQDVAFRQVHREDGGKISFRRVCTACARDVPYADVAKGYERPGGDLVVLNDEELASLPRERAHRIDVLSFTRPGQIDPILAARSYYLEPGESATRAYAVFREALRRTGKVAVVTVTLRQRESLAVLRARDGVLVLQTLLRPGEVAGADFPVRHSGAGPGAPELATATALIDAMTEDFDPAEHQNRYQQELDALIETKISGAPDSGAPVSGAPQQVIADGEPGDAQPDLAGALQSSLAAARSRQAPV
ncbi:MAG: Ku protein [Streptosporangiaceae bacterium]